MPILAIRWNNGVDMQVEAILPMSATFGYRVHPMVDLGLEGVLEGASYHGDPDKFDVGNPQLRYSVARAGPTVTLNFTPWLHLRLAGGYTFLRRFEYFDGLNEAGSYDLTNTGYAQASLSFGE